MILPGESLIIKMWETLTEKGIGGLLKPWQIRRVTGAQIDARRHEIITLAEAEKKAEEIRSGRLNLLESDPMLGLPTTGTPDKKLQDDTILNLVQALKISASVQIADSLRREVNVAKAILHAESELKDDIQNPPDRDIDSDWLFRWREYAGSVSSDKLQSLWGRVLAGELKSPGSFSYRTLDFIRNISTNEAKIIECISSFVIRDFIVSSQIAHLELEGITFKKLLELQMLGIISGVDSIGLIVDLKSLKQDKFIMVLLSHGRALLIEHNDPNAMFELKVYPLTNLGKQILSLGKFNPNELYLRDVAAELKKQVKEAEISIASYQETLDSKIHFSDIEPISLI